MACFLLIVHTSSSNHFTTKNVVRIWQIITGNDRHTKNKDFYLGCILNDFWIFKKPYHINKTEGTPHRSRRNDYSFKVFVHSLAQYSTFGPGSYGMNALKRMTGTKNFEQLPTKQKKCLVHNKEECQTQKYLDQVQRECKCIPWALGIGQGKYQVKARSIKELHTAGFHLLWPR